MIDEVVQEVRKAREEYAASFDFNIQEIIADLKAIEKSGKWKVVSFPSRPAIDVNVKLPAPVAEATNTK